MESPTRATMSLIDRLRPALSDRYRIEDEIGSGGMAVVFRARDLRHDRTVAVKVLKEEFAQSVGAERFLQEIRIVANLQHPHILALLDSGEVDGTPFYVMPFVEGESLREKLDRERELPVSDVLRVLTEVADALSFAHQHGVVHRDIKPDNILLSGRHALVADFGVAKALDAAQGNRRATTTGVSLGTPAYMAPEQAVGDGTVDCRADIYAVGILGYELLTGSPPFHGRTPQQILGAKLTGRPTPPSRLRPPVGEALSRHLMRCLEERPADRWQTADELLTQLEVLHTSTGEMGAWNLARATGRRRRWGVVVVGLGVVAISVVSWLVLRGGGAPTGFPAEANRVAVLPFQNHTGDASFDELGDVAADWITSGLAEIDSIQIVSGPAVEAALAEPGAGQDRPLWVARRTGAGLVVTGTVRAVGDSLELRAQLVEPLRGKVLDAFDAVRTPASDPTRGLGRVRYQIKGRLAQRLDDRFPGMTIADEPVAPSYEAYQAYMEGIGLGFQGRQTEAIAELDRASAADTSFLAPAVLVVVSLFNMGRWAKADSVIQWLEPRRARLSEFERGMLDLYRARLRGDNNVVYRLARDGYRRRPTSEGRLMTGLFAYRTNRLREAVRMLREEPESGLIRSAWHTGWHRALTGALHGLREYGDELDAARKARARFPDRPQPVLWEVRALIGSGRIDQAMATVDRGLTLSSEIMSPGGFLLEVGRELRFHGHPELAEGALRRGLEWYRTNGGGGDYRYGVGRALLWLQRADSAVLVFRDLAAEAPSSLDRLGYLGLALAAAGRVEEARRVDARLAAWSEPYVRGRNLYWRATIVARLGEKARATALLRDAVAQGVMFDLLHENEDLRPLWDEPSFRELLEPVG